MANRKVRLEDLLPLHESGMYIEDIAKALNVSKSTILLAKKRYGLHGYYSTRRNIGAEDTQEDIQECLNCTKIKCNNCKGG